MTALFLCSTARTCLLIYGHHVLDYVKIMSFGDTKIHSLALGGTRILGLTPLSRGCTGEAALASGTLLREFEAVQRRDGRKHTSVTLQRGWDTHRNVFLCILTLLAIDVLGTRLRSVCSLEIIWPLYMEYIYKLKWSMLKTGWIIQNSNSKIHISDGLTFKAFFLSSILSAYEPRSVFIFKFKLLLAY